MTLWIATHNPHKVEEIAGILGPRYALSSLSERPEISQVDEDGDTYRANALKKARVLWNHLGGGAPVFADDSGLEVDALGGRPGVHSMRYSAPNPTHAKNIAKLLAELREVPSQERTARFRCTVAYLDEAAREYLFEGVLEGMIAFAPQGAGGFGYDPVFFLPERGVTVAQLEPTEKNRISHRGEAVVALRRFLEERPGIAR